MIVAQAATVAHQVRGRLRLRLRDRHNLALLARVEAGLHAAAGVTSVRCNEAAGSLVVEYDPAQLSGADLLQLLLPEQARSQEMRPRVDESAFLPTTAERIWATLGDPARAPAHLPAILRLRETGPGRWQVMLDLLGQQLEGTVSLAEQVSDRRLVLVLQGAVSGRYVLSLTPQAGGTLVREQVAYELPEAFLSRALGRVAEPVIRRLVREHLGALPGLLAEQDSRAQPA